MQHIGLLLLYYLIAYVIVTLIGMFHTIFNIKVLHYKSMKENPGMGEAYEKTKPFHVLYNIIIFPIFAWFYFLTINNLFVSIALAVGAIWVGITIVGDLIGWVLIKHPWSLNFKEFYIDYQPWITLIYFAIFASPLLTYGLMRVL